jgi:hypothetical protein
LYINDLLKIISDVSKPTVFADDTSVVVTYSDPSEFKNNINNTFTKINNWLKSNLLSLNFDKSNFLQFITKSSQEIDMQIIYEGILIILIKLNFSG